MDSFRPNYSVQMGFDGIEHPGHIFIFRGTENQDDRPSREIIIQCLGQFLERVQVMSRGLTLPAVPGERFQSGIASGLGKNLFEGLPLQDAIRLPGEPCKLWQHWSPGARPAKGYGV